MLSLRTKSVIRDVRRDSQDGVRHGKPVLEVLDTFHNDFGNSEASNLQYFVTLQLNVIKASCEVKYENY